VCGSLRAEARGQRARAQEDGSQRSEVGTTEDGVPEARGPGGQGTECQRTEVRDQRSETERCRAEALAYMLIPRINHVTQGFIPAGAGCITQIAPRIDYPEKQGARY